MSDNDSKLRFLESYIPKLDKETKKQILFVINVKMPNILQDSSRGITINAFELPQQLVNDIYNIVLNKINK